jgi:hypothetical protein
MARVVRLDQGRQFSRCGCASTPAFGREVWAFGPAFCGLAEARPFRFLPQQSVCMLPIMIVRVHLTAR